MAANQIRWTVRDLDVMSDDWSSKRYEIIDGELIVTCAPHVWHQGTASKLNTRLGIWCEETGLGEVFQAPGLVFTESDAVIPDLVWASHEQLANGLDDAGHFIVAPELVVEVLSEGFKNEQRDSLGRLCHREAKLKLYSLYGVQEYWIANWQVKSAEVHRRQNAQLNQTSTLWVGDTLSSPLLPGFECKVASLFNK